MSDPRSLPGPETLLLELRRLAEERTRADELARRQFSERSTAVEKQHEAWERKAREQFQLRIQQLEKERRGAVERETAHLADEIAALKKEYQDSKSSIERQYETVKEKVKRAFKESIFEYSAIADTKRDALKDQHKASRKDLQEDLAHLDDLAKQQAYYLESCKLRHLIVETDEDEVEEGDRDQKGTEESESPDDQVSSVPSEAEFDEDAHMALKRELAELHPLLVRLTELSLPKLFQQEKLYVGLGAVYAVVAILAAIGMFAWEWPSTLVGGGMALFLAALVVTAIVVRRRCVAVVQPLQVEFANRLTRARSAGKLAAEQLAAKQQRELAAIRDRKAESLQAAEQKYEGKRQEAKSKRETDLAALEARIPPRIAELEQRRAARLAELDEALPAEKARLEEEFRHSSLAAKEERDRLLGEANQRLDQERNTWSKRWCSGFENWFQQVDQVCKIADRLFPPWSDPAWSEWVGDTEMPPFVPYGRLNWDLSQMEGILPKDPELLPPKEHRSIHFPTVIRFPDEGSLLVRASDEGKRPADDLLLLLLYRLLLRVPPGKLRFTIIDPIGLGQQFAGLMHLADIDEQLVTNRIWTEPGHIEQRLADLTAHMETVIQKYLRNEFASIEDYNVEAGEIAEPFRFLVISQFPANFTEAAARRLLSILASGARCGVYTLIAADTKQSLPHGISWKDVESLTNVITWKNGRFHWQSGSLGTFPIQLDPQPPVESMTPLVQRVGEAAKQASRVEVPFDWIAPPRDQWWTASTAGGIHVPLGRSGATRLQYLTLGKGTSQHVLIAGKTGSGKSSLLHALITNSALLYRPEELELYLIDFKKGVEFKAYARLRLPHARVIAIESEREFGLSVMQRLDTELRLRGEQFRDLGVQDLPALRQAHPELVVPRILLIVDEFQEMFTEDDRLAQEASLLLDRLVRQGRAFGIHVHLGSQTLGGAYGLPRSTLGQMAVRIALQCSEADAHLILSEENSAARLLSRPGEAIYNDANGMVEGNHPFQVAWLADERREELLSEVAVRASERGFIPRQVIFEGNAPAELERNTTLSERWEQPAPESEPRPLAAFLGDAIAIKDPTTATFRPQSGGNLLLLGQNDKGAIGVVSSILTSLASQFTPQPAPHPRIFFLDGLPTESTFRTMLDAPLDALAGLVWRGAIRDSAPCLTHLVSELNRRQAAGEGDGEATRAGGAPPMFLVLFDLQRFRKLRKKEDDFSFSRSEDAAAEPADQLVLLLKEGPTHGIHVLVWCDSLANFQRTFDRQAQREFEHRVLFQMSAADSSLLIDTPAASALGPHRALYACDEEGILEKFRPYGAPESPWWGTIREKLRRRGFPDAVFLPSPDVPSETGDPDLQPEDHSSLGGSTRESRWGGFDDE